VSWTHSVAFSFLHNGAYDGGIDISIPMFAAYSDLGIDQLPIRRVLIKFNDQITPTILTQFELEFKKSTKARISF